MISAYWSAQGRSDRLTGFPPKSEAFFVAWFGPRGVEIHQAYLSAYRSAR